MNISSQIVKSFLRVDLTHPWAKNLGLDVIDSSYFEVFHTRTPYQLWRRSVINTFGGHAIAFLVALVYYKYYNRNYFWCNREYNINIGCILFCTSRRRCHKLANVIAFSEGVQKDLAMCKKKKNNAIIILSSNLLQENITL